MRAILSCKRAIIISTTALLAVLFFFILFLTVMWIQVTSPMNDSAALPADCAIVFGAAVYGNKYPGPAIVRRIATASALYREGKVRRLIVSGGRGSGNFVSEASVMRDEAILHGVRSEDITLEDQSHSTWENLTYSKNLTSSCSSIVGISDGYHLARIKLLAKRQGWGDLPTIPAQIQPDRVLVHRSLQREFLGYAYYFFRIDQFVPTDVFLKYVFERPEKVPASKE